MRTYNIHYYVESNDECQEREIEIQAKGMLIAFAEFRSHVRVFKRIFKIEEKAEPEFKVDVKDPNFDKPIGDLEKEY